MPQWCMSALVGRKLRDHVRWTHARCQTLGVRCQTLEADFADYPAYWWESGRNNWGAVCACSVGIAFLYEETDAARRRAALSRVLATMDAFLNSFPPDGTCEEGVGYWEYGSPRSAAPSACAPPQTPLRSRMNSPSTARHCP